MDRYLNLKNFLSIVVGVCLVGLAFISLHIEPDKIKYWQAWVWSLAIIGIVCIVVQSVMQSREDHDRKKREKEQDERFSRIETYMVKISSGKEAYIDEEPNQSTNVLPAASPQEQLASAQDAVFSDIATRLPMEDLKEQLAQDVGFRSRFYSLSYGRYPKFDDLRQSIAKDPIIAGRIIRSRLVQRTPYAQQVREIYALMKRPFDSVSDFLFEISLVNITDNPTTIDEIEADAEIGGVWKQLVRVDDLSDYQMIFEKPGTEGRPFMNLDAVPQELEGLWPKVKGVKIERGIAFEGWIGFQTEIPSAEFDKPAHYRIRIVDALGGIHPVVVSASRPQEESGRIRHSPQVYARLRS